MWQHASTFTSEKIRWRIFFVSIMLTYNKTNEFAHWFPGIALSRLSWTVLPLLFNGSVMCNFDVMSFEFSSIFHPPSLWKSFVQYRKSCETRPRIWHVSVPVDFLCTYNVELLGSMWYLNFCVSLKNILWIFRQLYRLEIIRWNSVTRRYIPVSK